MKKIEPFILLNEGVHAKIKKYCNKPTSKLRKLELREMGKLSQARCNGSNLKFYSAYIRYNLIINYVKLIRLFIK